MKVVSVGAHKAAETRKKCDLASVDSGRYSSAEKYLNKGNVQIM